MHTITPRTIAGHVLDFCRSVVPNGAPEYLAVEPAPHAQANECYPAVEEMVHNHGGSICYGWQIWEWPFVMIEAEFHAVWRDPNRLLHDITPKESPHDRILFLPDPNRQYEGRLVNNIRRALLDAPEVSEFFAAADAEFKFKNQHGQLLVGDAQEYESIVRRKMLAQRRLVSRQPSPGRNDHCPCGSGLKFKKCHGK